MKHYLKWLMYLLSKQKQGVNGDEVKLSKSMLIKTMCLTSFTVVIFFINLMNY